MIVDETVLMLVLVLGRFVLVARHLAVEGVVVLVFVLNLGLLGECHVCAQEFVDLAVRVIFLDGLEQCQRGVTVS